MLERTYIRRKDMLKSADLTEKDLEFLRDLKKRLTQKEE